MDDDGGGGDNNNKEKEEESNFWSSYVPFILLSASLKFFSFIEGGK